MEKLQDRIIDRRLIIRGDLASCYRGQDARLDRMVFLKIMNPALSADDEIRARFEREAKAAARLDHPNLVHIHEFGEDLEEGLYMILEWVSGQSLRELLKAGKRFSNAELLVLAEQLLSGLSELHHAGILHRDVKPENILMGDDGRARITDFSLAALQGSVRLTHHQAIVGTPAYLSPEQAAGQSPDYRSDLFAAGVVLLELATGENPFNGGELLESIRRVREVKVDVPSLLGDKSSDELTKLITACLEKNPKQRLASAEAGLLMIGKQAEANASKPSNRRSSLWLIPALGVILLAIVIAFLQFGDSEDKQPVAVTDTLLFTEVINETETSDTIVVKDSPADDAEQNSNQSSIVDKVKTETSEESESQKDSSTEKAIAPPFKAQDSPAQFQNREAVIPDSIEVLLSTDPWAHVMIDGKQIGTTPFKEALRVPVGVDKFTLHNPAYPVIMAECAVSDTTTAVHFALADYVAAVEFRVLPWGEIYVDNEHQGTTPLANPIYLLPGVHQLRVVHPALPTITEDVMVAAGDSLKIMVDLNKTELAVVPAKGMK